MTLEKEERNMEREKVQLQRGERNMARKICISTKQERVKGVV